MNRCHHFYSFDAKCNISGKGYKLIKHLSTRICLYCNFPVLIFYWDQFLSYKYSLVLAFYGKPLTAQVKENSNWEADQTGLFLKPIKNLFQIFKVIRYFLFQKPKWGRVLPRLEAENCTTPPRVTTKSGATWGTIASVFPIGSPPQSTTWSPSSPSFFTSCLAEFTTWYGHCCNFTYYFLFIYRMSRFFGIT